MFNLSKNVDYQFIARAHSDCLSPEEKEYFEQWLSESEKNRETYSQVALLLDKVDFTNSPPLPDKNLQWQRIKQKVVIETDRQLLNEKLPTSQTIVSKIILPFEIAIEPWKTVYTSKMVQFAVILVLIATYALHYLMTNYKINTDTNDRIVANISKNVEIKTKRGEKLSVTLPDGSKVHLNTLSKLIYPEDFGEKTRDVVLEGEAYFSVKSNKEKPFSVKSGEMLTVVRGTEFDIKRRGSLTSVVVVKGLVDTYSPSKQEAFKLKKGDLLYYDEKAKVSKLQKANLRHYLAWRNDKFSFEHTRLADVMEEIGRYYNINSAFQNDSLKNITLTGFFDSDSLNKMLSVIGLTLDIKINYKDRTIIINKN